MPPSNAEDGHSDGSPTTMKCSTIKWPSPRTLFVNLAIMSLLVAVVKIAQTFWDTLY